MLHRWPGVRLIPTALVIRPGASRVPGGPQQFFRTGRGRVTLPSQDTVPAAQREPKRSGRIVMSNCSRLPAGAICCSGGCAPTMVAGPLHDQPLGTQLRHVEAARVGIVRREPDAHWAVDLVRLPLVFDFGAAASPVWM